MAREGALSERTALTESMDAPQAAGTSSQSALQRTPTSDYLVLSRIDSYNQDVHLPRPRFWYILPMFGILDAAYTVSSAAAFGVQGKNEILMVTWGLVRAVLTVVLTYRRRVREIGWVIVGCAFISALAALAELNLIIQRKAFTSTVPATLALYCFSHLFFGLLHWLAFAAIVGISRDRNPYGLGLQSVRRRPGPWREGVANIQVRRASMMRDLSEGRYHAEGQYDTQDASEGDEDWDNRLRRKRNALEESFRSDEDDDKIHSDDEDETSEDEDDVPIDATLLDYDEDEDEGELAQEHHGYIGSPPRMNDVIDIIPSPSTATGTRHRTISQSKSLRSRRSFYARISQDNSPEDGLGSPNQLSSDLSPISPMSGYGTFRSLAGI